MDTKQETLLFNLLAEIYMELDWEGTQPERKEEESPALSAEKIKSHSEKRFGERMERRVRSELKKRQRKSVIKRAAVVILAVLIGTAGLFMTNESVRAGIMRLLWRVYPSGVVYYFYQDKSQYKGHFRVFEPTWLPEEYAETERFGDEFSGISITYETTAAETEMEETGTGAEEIGIEETGTERAGTEEHFEKLQKLYFDCSNERQVIGMTIPIKNAQAQKVIYQGEEAEFYESEEENGQNAFIWRNEYGCLFSLRGNLGLEEFQKIADSIVEIERVPMVEVSVEAGKEASMTAEWPALLDKECFGYDFWGMCRMDWNAVEKKLKKEREKSYTVTYHYLQENQTLLEFRDSLADYEGIASLRAIFQDEVFGVGEYTMYFHQEKEMEEALTRIQEELLTIESWDTTCGLQQFTDGEEKRIEVRQEEETENGFYVVKIRFRKDSKPVGVK